MLGYPGSGKSTVARMIATKLGAILISSDEIRKWMFSTQEEIINIKLNPYVFGALDYAAHTYLSAGSSVIYDANNNKRSVRNKKTKLLAAPTKTKTVVIWVKTPKKIAIEREKARSKNHEYLPIPRRRYEQLVNALEPPHNSELLIEIDGTRSRSRQQSSFMKQYSDISS